MCEHSYQYMGLQYANGSRKLPGSGAVRRYYAHVFFCIHCTEMKASLLEEFQQDSYTTVIDGAVPGDRKLIVPKSDRDYYSF